MPSEAEARVALSRHAEIKRRGDRDILVLPERAVRLGGSGGEILRLCDGSRSSHEIVVAMQERYPGEEQIGDFVLGFLDEMRTIGCLEASG